MATKSIPELIDALTLDEKVLLLEGTTSWHSNSVERLGIPELFLTDGPHGVRKARGTGGLLGVIDNIPATAFPPAATVAGSWSPENARLIGAAIAREGIDLDVDVLLAPGINIKRNPLCGRNFEYFSEDPLLSGALGSAFIRGAQAEGVATTVKHFAANSNENFRFVGDSLVDERALREIYLRQFEHVIKEAKPATVMCSYNAVNGVFGSDNRELLTDILRTEWGFDGLVMTDWGATHDRVISLAAGCELDMPGDNPHNRRRLTEAVRDGRIPIETLDEAVRRMLSLVLRERPERDCAAHDADEHAGLAHRIAAESAVLLSNDGTLPLSPEDGVVVVGEMFKRMRFQGAGSSLITPTTLVTPMNAFDRRGIRYRYARGYRGMDLKRDATLEKEALELATAGKTVLFFGGLSDLEESEGFDRTTMAMATNQIVLLEALLDAGARVVLVLFAGAPVELPFVDRLAGVLDMYLPGMMGGEAAADLLFGVANPSGKLAESWPLTAADASSAADYDRDRIAQYYESIYVGYRFYDAAQTPLRFAFGHGLSYSTFRYDSLDVRQLDDRVEVSVSVTNTSERDGTEVVQLYVGNNHGAVFKADKELRAFTRVDVPAGQTVTASMSFALAELCHWDAAEHGWVLENGDYEMLAAASASDIRLRAPLSVTSGRESRSPYSAAIDAAYARPPAQIPAEFPELLGAAVPPPVTSRRLTMETRLINARRTFMGEIMYRIVLSRMMPTYRKALAMPDSLERDAKIKNSYFIIKMMPFSSLRSLVMSSSGEFAFHVAEGIADIAEGHLFRGLRKILFGPST